MSKQYHIKEGYISRKTYTDFDDTQNTDDYQDEVYETAYKVCKQNNLSTVLDIGCGSGYKLIKYFKDFNFTGTELEPTLTWLIQSYPNYDWRRGDFSKPPKEAYDVISRRTGKMVNGTFVKDN